MSLRVCWWVYVCVRTGGLFISTNVCVYGDKIARLHVCMIVYLYLRVFVFYMCTLR